MIRSGFFLLCEIMLLFGVFSFVSLANYNTGILGSWANNGLHFLFGMGAFLSVLVIIFMGGYYVLTAKPFHSNRYFYYFGVLFCLCLSLIHHCANRRGIWYFESP